MAGIAHVIRETVAENSAEEKFRLAVEACPNGMVMTDAAGRIVLVNAATEQLFGYSRHELMGKPIEFLVPERLRNEHIRQRASFARHPRTRRVGQLRELAARHRDGREFPVEIGLNPIRTRDGLLVLSVIFDISERKRVERLKDEFVSTVSHELRTPLTSIAGSLGLLIGGAAGALPEAAARLITIAQTNSQRLVRLINDILDIEKIESGRVAFKFKRLDARELVEQAIEANRGYADGFGVRVRLDAAPSDSRSEVYADADRLAQVITNLLSNAIKFSPGDGEVIVGIEPNNETVRITVRDHGPGIPSEFRLRIFEKFAQADASDARKKGGTGLGLSIVKQIVARLGGAVGFEDAAGGGTVFYVLLPAWANVASREIDPVGGPDTARILLCEDDLDTAAALRDGLRGVGFSTDFAHSPADAIASAQATPYTAIVVDLDLPDGDGLGLIYRLREHPEIYKTPLIVMSDDHGGDQGSFDSAKLNILECVKKPLNIERLVQILDRRIAHDPQTRPQILHVDDDSDVRDLVAQQLSPIGNVVSVDSIEEARYALIAQHFDLAILDIAVGPVSGLSLLPELQNRNGKPIPVIVFSANSGYVAANAQVKASLSKSSSASLKDLVAAVHDRLMLRSSNAPEQAS